MSAYIKYVAPMQRIYNDEGVFVGEIPRCKIKYDELIAKVYREKDAAKWSAFFGSIWCSYFNAGTCAATSSPAITNGIWHGMASRIIDLHETPDTVRHFLRDEQKDTSLAERIITDVKRGKIRAWNCDSRSFTQRLNPSKLHEMVAGDIDTIVINDPGTSAQRIIVMHKDFVAHMVHQYQTLEKWSFDPLAGKTETTIYGLAPEKDMIDFNGNITGTKKMFWVLYPDIHADLDSVAQYHPASTFALHIWNSYFSSCTKPDYVVW